MNITDLNEKVNLFWVTFWVALIAQALVNLFLFRLVMVMRGKGG